MAEVTKKVTGYSGGIETKMSTLAGVFLIFNLIAAAVSVFLFLTSLTVTWIVLSLACIVQGFVLYIILEAGAEVIRLLKKQAGLQYGGEISRPMKPIYNWVCSACSYPLEQARQLDEKEGAWVLPKECPKCGESLRSPDKPG